MPRLLILLPIALAAGLGAAAALTVGGHGPSDAAPGAADAAVRDRPGVPAGGFVADAFGILPAPALTAERAAWAGVRTGAAGTEAQAPEAVDAVLFFLGPKSLVAGVDDGHAVSIGLDRFGNLAAGGAAARFVLGDRQAAGVTRHGIGDVLFRPEPVAGARTAGAEIAGRQGARATFRVTADLASMTPRAIPPGDAVEAETLADLATAPLADQFGNAAEDGVATTMILGHGDGAATVLTAAVSDGRARARLLTRDLPGSGTLRSVLGRAASPPVGFTLRSLRAQGAAPVRLWPLAGIGAVALRAGPFQTDAGHLLGDGATIRVTLKADGQLAVAAAGWLRDGHFETMIPVDPGAGPFEVRVETALGLQTDRVAVADAPLPATPWGAQ